MRFLSHRRMQLSHLSSSPHRSNTMNQVPTRFQSVEQYCDILRGLLLEEIFATLVASLGGGGGGGDNGGGRGGRPQATATFRISSFVEAGEGGFSHVTLTSGDDWSGGGGGGGGFASPASNGCAHRVDIILSCH